MTSHPDDIAINKAQIKLFDMGKIEHLPVSFKDPNIVAKVRQEIKTYDESKNDIDDSIKQTNDTPQDKTSEPEPDDATDPDENPSDATDPDETPEPEPGDVTDPDENPSDVTQPEPSDVTDPDENPSDVTQPEPSDVTDPDENPSDVTQPSEVAISDDPLPPDNTVYYAMGVSFVATCIVAVLIKKYWFKN